MKFLLSVLLIAFLSFFAGLYFPWWSIAVIAFIVALILKQPLLASFLSGFMGIFLLWAILATWIDLRNEHILSHRIAELFKIGGSSFLLILITAFIGGVVAGVAALSGSSISPAAQRL
jgi:hypothetical protein